MSLRPQILTGNWSRGTDQHVWGGNVSAAVSVFGQSTDTFQAVRTICYVTSGEAGLLVRFNELSTGSRQYYQFHLHPPSSFVAIEEINYSTVYTSPTVLGSRAFSISGNQSFYAAFEAVTFNASQDRLRGYVNDMMVLEYIGALHLSSGKCGLMVQSGVARFDSKTVAGGEIDLYCTVQDVYDLLRNVGIDAVTNEGEIMALIAKGSQHLNDKTYSAFGRFVKVTGERHDGDGDVTIILDHRPLGELLKVVLKNYNNDVVWTGTAGDSDFDSLIIEDDIGAITRPQKILTYTPPYGVGIYPIENLDSYKNFDYTQYWGIGRRNVIFDYTYGFSDVPQDIWDATRKLAAIEALTKFGSYNTQGAMMIRLGDAMEDYRGGGATGAASMPFGGVIGDWRKDVAETIKRYRVTALGDV